MTPRELRIAAGLSQLTIAARAGVSLGTLRLYEANQGAVGAFLRDALDKTYAALRPTGGA